MTQPIIVSDPSEHLILVDSTDLEIGHMSKADCHQGSGTRHRAFSIHLIDSRGRLLLQKRGADKQLWPLFWSNSCCSHPRLGESMAETTRRRLQEELGIQCPVEYLYKFEYQAHYLDLGAEWELCWVYLGLLEHPPHMNPAEIAELGYFSPDEIDALVSHDPAVVTPWFSLEWEYLKTHYAERFLQS